MPGATQNGRRLTLYSEGDLKPSVDIEIRLGGNLPKRVLLMTTYEVLSIVLAILALLVSLVGIIVKLIIELINAKK